jgi:uncharacterized membrane-anchored protein YhcB (DUF1043 family)
VEIVLSALLQIFSAHGILGAGWLIALGFVIYFARSLVLKERENKKLKEQREKDLEIFSKKLEEIHNKHTAIIAEMSDKRIEDLKDLIQDYNDVCNNMLASFEKIGTKLKK